MDIIERGQEITSSIIFLFGTREIGDEMLPCVSPHTNRPRSYALMREDYLWSPLQNACSMQHLRSVLSIGRQCGPPPSLTCPTTTTHYLFLANLSQYFSSQPPASSFPLQVPWVVCLYFTLACFLKPWYHNMQIHGNHSTTPCCLCTHIFTNTGCLKGKAEQRKLYKL